MFDETTLLMICAAGVVGCLAFFGLRLTMGGEDDAKLRGRLSKAPANAGPAAPLAAAAVGGGSKARWAAVSRTVVRLGQAAAHPFMPTSREKVSGLRQSLNKAGLYNPSALRALTGAKVILLPIGLVGGYLVGAYTDKMMLMLPVGGLVGYLAPMIWLRTRVNGNQRALTFGLPDALDLMVVCVEAGLTVDAALQRVGQELGLAHPAIGREFGIAHMETRVGLTRADALKNIGVRTGNAQLQSLAAMLVQADRFGTSIAQALRVHAETMRLNRQHAAEEMAAKASVKISFPLVLFIFPSTFIVLCGPTIIDLMNSSLFN
ncbi:MAG: tight adherence protein [Phycisphaerales bacterium]|nr:tight adherence protein [Phycisphaerales bacterium]